MAALEEETLESLLTKATSPLATEVNWPMVTLFTERIKRSPSLASNAIRLLAHKIQSPVQKEAVYALSTLEECAKVCGPAFHTELGKFRFLNEMIKIVSPKYLGNQTSDEVKDKCIDLMYSWTKDIRQESKIQEAYDMLKSQGIVKTDPLTHEQKFPERKPDLLFKDEQSSKTLDMLLKSKHPDDLQAANRLIKLMVRQDIETTEKKCARQSKLDTIDNNIEVLTEMMTQHRVNQSTLTERDVMSDIYANLEDERPNLFKLASEFEATDQIKDILETNDRVMKVMEDFRKLFPDTRPPPTSQATPTSQASMSSMSISSKNTGDVKAGSLLKFSPTKDTRGGAMQTSLLDASCLPLNKSSSPSSSRNNVAPTGGVNGGAGGGAQRTDGKRQPPAAEVKQTAYQTSLAQLDMLGRDLLQKSLSKNQEAKTPEVVPLTDVEVDVDSIEPASEDPISVYCSPDKHVTLDLYLCVNAPRDDVAVYALSMRSSMRGSKVTEVKFDMTPSSKNQLLKLQTANQNYLPAYNPIFPSKTISQVLLLANPKKEPMKLEYNLSYLIGEDVIMHTSSIQL